MDHNRTKKEWMEILENKRNMLSKIVLDENDEVIKLNELQNRLYNIYNIELYDNGKYNHTGSIKSDIPVREAYYLVAYNVHPSNLNSIDEKAEKMSKIEELLSKS